MTRVYLAGTISPRIEHRAWREAAWKRFAGSGTIEIINPLRWGNGRDEPIDQSRAFCNADLYDVRTCDCLFVGFPLAIDRQSIGTWAEMGIALDRSKFIVVWSPLEEILHHEFVTNFSGYITDVLSQAFHVIETFADKGADTWTPTNGTP